MKTLEVIANKVANDERLTPEEGLYLFETEHLKFVAQLADFVRKKRVGDTVFFSSTLFVHPTNLCELSCPMCSFYAKPNWKKAWFHTPRKIEEKVLLHYQQDKINEVHIVGGLWRECDLDYYKELFTRIKEISADIHIKALSPVEYDFLAKLHKISIEEVFTKMMDWGLGSLPGGGAEILVEEIRKQIAPQKINTEEYLNAHKVAHKVGLHSNMTMLFGHVEGPKDIIDHLCKVRDLQDLTHGFQTFVPLRYSEQNNALGTRKERIKPKELQRIYAISRLMLDNIPNIKVLWNYIGIQEAQQMLNCGANDLGSTAIEEKVIEMAGGTSIPMTAENMKKLIKEKDRTPKQVHSGHTSIR